MIQEIILVTGATGKVGGALTKLLLKAGKSVRIISRDTENTTELKAQGVDVRIGSLHDKAFVQKSFEGVKGAFVMLPPNYQSKDLRAEQRRITDNYIHAIKENGTKYIVSLSSIGAHLSEKGGIIQPLYDLEQELNALPELNVVHLRPGYFMENLYAQLGLIAAHGHMAAPIREDLKMGVVATADIAAVAAGLLSTLDFTGHHVQFVLGERDLTYGEMANAIGQAAGIAALPYKIVSMQEAYQTSIGMGMSPEIALLLNEYIEQVNEGRVSEGAVRTAENTTPTSIETFAHQFAYAIPKSTLS